MTVTPWCGFAAGAASMGFYAGNATTIGTTTQGVSTVGGRLAVDTNYGSVLGTMANLPTPGANDFIFYSFGLYVATGGVPAAGVDDTMVNLQTGQPALSIIGVDASTYNLGLSNLTAAVLYVQGTTALAVDTWYDIRIAKDIAGDLVYVWIGSALEFTHSIAIDASLGLFTLAALAAGVGKGFVSCGIACVGNSLADRPGIPKGFFLYPNGNNDSTTFGDDNINCHDGAGTYTNWDDWATIEQDGATTMNVECGGNSGKEISTLNTATIDTALTARMAIVASSSAANTGSKTVATYHVLKDIATATEAEFEQTNLVATTYEGRRTRFASPPAGAWTDYVNGTTFNHASASKTLGLGVRSVSTNGANDNHSAIGIEVFSWNDDPVVSGVVEKGIKVPQAVNRAATW